MKFGKHLAAVAIPHLRHLYADYKALKKQLKLVVQEQSASPAKRQWEKPVLGSASAQATLLVLCEQELVKVQRAAQRLADDCQARLARTAQQCAKQDPLAPQLAREDAALVLELDQFLTENREAFRKFAKKHDKQLGPSALAAWLAQRCADGLQPVQLRLSHFVLALSDVHCLLSSQRQQEQAQPASVWVPPASFERQTVKYLVPRRALMRLKLAVVQHLPVLVVGRPQPTTAVPDDFLTVPDAAGISSVYLDNSQRESYHDRMLRDEGARLFRIRWYGDYYKIPPQVFVERKTHHEQWVRDSSLKERFELPAAQVPDLLAGRLVPESALGREVAEEVCAKRYAPAVRTVYSRCAFQRADTNAVRISLDTDLTFLKEQPGEPWCRPVPETGLAPGELVEFGYAVLEVKLQGDQPEWVTQIVEDEDLVIEMKKFSKFAHGTATFAPKAELRVLPYWFEQFGADGCGDYDSDDADEAEPARPAVAATTALAPEEAAAPKDSGPKTAGPTDASPKTAGPKTLGVLPTLLPALRPPSSKTLRPAKIEPKTYFANERTFIQWLSPVIFLLGAAAGFQSFGAQFSSVTATYTGLAFSLVSLVFMLYAFATYRRRMGKIARKDPSGYEERTGPAFLVLLLGSLAVVTMVPLWGALPRSPAGVACPAADLELLLPGVFPEPSGLAWADGALVVALRHQLAVFRGGAAAEVHALPGDFEGATGNGTAVVLVTDEGKVTEYDLRSRTARPLGQLPFADDAEGLAADLEGFWAAGAKRGAPRKVARLSADLVPKDSFDLAALCRHALEPRAQATQFGSIEECEEAIEDRGKVTGLHAAASTLYLLLPKLGALLTVDLAAKRWATFDLPHHAHALWEGILVREGVAYLADDEGSSVHAFRFGSDGFACL